MRRVKEYIIVVINKSNLLLYIHNWVYKIINYRKFLAEIKKRRRLSIFNYQELSKPVPFYPIVKTKDSNFYGYGYSIMRYANCTCLPYSLEHGLHYANFIPKKFFYKTTKHIMTFSFERKKIIQSSINKKIIPIGPYIHYAKHYLTKQDIICIKRKFGRILLVFPSHSTLEHTVDSHVNEFVSHVLYFKKKYDFDSVFVSLYFRDIQNSDLVKAYEKVGFHVVCSGHLYDPFFISRLKSIIALSDYTISNTVGTHLGYCIYMNKPHYILSNADNTDFIQSNDNNLVNEINHIASFFTQYQKDITEEQWLAANRYWGFNCIKSKEEMWNIIRGI